MRITPSRRRFLASASLAGATSLIGASKPLRAEPPPETTVIRIVKARAICLAPQYVAEELLRAEGFSDVRYVALDTNPALQKAIADGEADFSLNFSASLVISIDKGDPVTVVAGIHPGCFELFGNERIHSIADLKGKSVGIEVLGSGPHVFLSVMAAYVGLDPARDINWITSQSVRPMDLFAEGKTDAFLGFAPEPQEVRARKLGHAIVNSALDRPWSQYFWRLLEGNREFVRSHPIATKRVLRAILKAADLCAAEPGRVAQRLVDGDFGRYDYALQSMNDVPYGKWRDYDPEDTLRFYALRLHEVGLIKSSPQRIIADGTDWRFLNELKRELKA